jgi:hypothetical protein
MDDLYGVGPGKPVGYLSIEAIYRRGENPDAVARLSQQRGLSTFWHDPPVGKPHQGMNMGKLYVYDDLAMAHLLQQNAGILSRHQWPVVPAEFVARLATEKVDLKRQADLYKLIAWAFNDPGPEYARPRPGEPLTVRAPSWLGRLASGVLRR